jgi:hypothetical protein
MQRGAEKTWTVCQSKWSNVSTVIIEGRNYHEGWLTDHDSIYQLKSSYNAVLEIKRASGFAWSDEHGAGITLENENAWTAFVKVCTDVATLHHTVIFN